MKVSQAIFWVLLLISSYDLYAQRSILAQTNTDRDKLTERFVSKIVQDHAGFLWIGTNDGLNRYDGHTFLQFKNNFEPPYNISGEEVKNILVLRDGNLAIHYRSLWKGIDVLNVADFVLTPLDLSMQLSDDESIIAIDKDERGDLLIVISSIGLTKVLVSEADSKISEKYSIEHVNEPAIFYKHSELSDWLVLKNGAVIEIDQDGQKRRSFSVPAHSDKLFLRKFMVNFIELQEDGEFIFSFEAVPGLYTLKPEESKPNLNEDYGFTDRFFRWIQNDTKGNRILFAGSSFNQNADLFLNPEGTKTLKDISDQNTTQNEATCVFGEDFNRGFYLGTVDDLTSVNFTPDYFRKKLEQKVVPGQWGTSVRGIAKDPFQNLIVAREINEWFRISPDGLVDTLAIMGDQNSYQADMKCSRDLIVYNSNIYGSVHLENDSFRLLIFDPVTAQTRAVPILHHIQTLALGNDVIWIGCGVRGSEGALYKYLPNENRLEQFFNADGSNPFNNNEIQAIAVNDDEIWLGGHGELYKMNEKESVVNSYSQENGSLFPNGSMVINDLMIHSDGHLYIGYAMEGFDVLNVALNEKKRFSIQDGLAQENVASMIEDLDGNVWIGTYNGLSKFHPASEEFTSFYEVDGISHNEFNRFSGAKDDEGNIYMGSLNGIIYFNPQEIASSNKTPRLMINSLKYFNTKGEELNLLGDFSKEIHVTLPADYRSLKMNLSMDNYFSDNGNHFQYQIGDTISNNWSDNGKNKELSLNFLRAGVYPLFVRGVERGGRVSKNVAEVKLRVRQYIYESKWFYITLAILAGGLAFLFFRNLFNQKLKMLKMRQEISRDLHDEVGSLLTGIAMKTDLLAMKVPQENKMEVTKLSSMGREAVRQMRDIVWSIDNKKNSVGDLTDRIREFGHEVLEEKGIVFNLDVKGLDADQEIPQEVRKNIYLIVREAINNVVKHSQGSRVAVNLWKRGNICHVTIQDNGHIDNGQLGRSGLGLKNMHERSEKIGGYIDITTENGFLVNLTFPSFL